MARSDDDSSDGGGEDIGIVVLGSAAVKAEEEKLDLILKLHEDGGELKDDYKGVYDLAALVAALILSFLVSIEGYAIETHPDNMWGDNSEDVIVDLYHLTAGASAILCLFIIIISVIMLNQLSHVPNDGVEELFRDLGMMLVHFPPLLVAYLYYLFGINLGLNFSLSMRTWVAVLNIIMLVLLMAVTPYLTHRIINAKMKTLRRLDKSKGKRSGQNAQSNMVASNGSVEVSHSAR